MAGLMWVITEAFESRTQNVQSQRSGHDSFYSEQTMRPQRMGQKVMI